MRILITTAFDAGNLAIENIVKELVARGHQLEVYARYSDEQSVRMFTALGLPVHPEKELTPAVIKQFDIAFCTIDAMQRLRLADIYIFSYNIETDTWISEGADFLFTFVRDRHLRILEDCATMPLGNAKNDVPKSNEPPKKQILFIDAGHNPFGVNGKLQVANMLLDICHCFPDYNLVVKPRWLLNGTGKQSHRSRPHLYTLLSQITKHQLPDNLVLLNEHRNMQELIDESVSVLTTSLSSYWDVILRDKGCIVVDGLDSEEQIETRSSFRNTYEDARRAGCCVNYNEVTKYLPLGLFCNPEHLKRRIPYPNDVSSRVVDVMEYIYEIFLRQGKFPAIRNYDYETFQHGMEADPALTLEQLKYKRFKNGALYGTRIFEQFKAQLDYSEYYKLLDQSYQDYPLTERGFQDFIRKMNEEKNKLFFENQSVFMEDPIDQSLLMQRLYDAGHEDEILKLPVETILCSSAYNYYLGMIYKKNGETLEALNHFLSFLKEANARTFCKYPQENDWGIRKAYNYIFSVYDGENIPAEDFADIYCDLYEHRDWVIVNYNNRKRAHNLLPKAADVLADSDPIRALKCLQLYAKYEYHYNIREREQRIRSLIQDMNVLRSAKLFHLKEKVKLLFKKMKGGVKCYREHGLKYTLNRVREKAKSKFGQHAVFRIWDIFTNKVMNGYRLYAGVMQKYGENARLFVSSPAMGDVYIFSSLLHAYLQMHYPEKDAVLGVYGQGGKTIASMFEIKQVEVFNIQEIHYLYNLIMFCPPNTVFLESLHYHVFYRHTAILAYLEGLHQFNFFSFNQAYLDVLDQPVSKPKFLYDEEFINDQFREKKLQKGKTVVLSPYAKSVKRIPIPFWNALSDRLRREGFSVCTNSASEAELPIAGTLPVSFPMDKSVPFLENAGTSIGLRSGFLDVISSADCLKISLCHQEAWKRGLIYKDYESYNLSQMYHQPNQYDLLYSPETEDTLIDEIVQMVTTYTQENGNR